MINVAGSVGRWTLNQLAVGAQVSVLMVETMTWMIVAPLRGKGLRFKAAVENFVEFGVRSLPIVGMICFLVGVILALQSSYTLGKWGAIRFIATLVAVSALREMGPLMTVILITGDDGDPPSISIDMRFDIGWPIDYLIAADFTLYGELQNVAMES